MAARAEPPDRAMEALEILCRTYWYPLYAYVRRRGFSPHDAQDLTQAFFAHLLGIDFLKSIAREKGKFRSFLLAALNHFLANEWDKAQTAKRGGGARFISLDDEAAESRYRLEPVDEASPEKIFARRWALTLLEQVMTRLRAEFAANGKAELFDELKAFLSGGHGKSTYADVAARLRLTEGAVKVAVHRLRQRNRQLLRAEIAHTVSSPAEIDDEIKHLFAALSG